MKNSHLVNLDILRGIAALLVVYAHGITRDLWGGYFTGQVGVAIFFSLSGFLMGYLYSTKEFNCNSVYKYVVSRFARIAPAYLTIVMMSFLIFNYLDNEFVYKISEQNILRHLLFSGNFHVFWTIPPEVQFYIFFLVIWLSVQSIGNGSKIPLILTGLISIVLIYFGEQFPGATLPFTIHLFLFGCVAGVVRNKIDLKPVVHIHYYQIALFFLTIILGMYLLKDGKSAIFGFFSNVPYAVLCAITVYFLSLVDIPFRESRLKKLFVLIGKCSFSLYLIHDIILYLYEKADLSMLTTINFLICFSLSILISYMFYTFYELPLNKYIKHKLINTSEKVIIGNK